METVDSQSFISRKKGEDDSIKEVLKTSLEMEEDLMRTYLITAERVHDDAELKERLENFAEGNAKRTKQLIDELNKGK
jgi:rubrerythrin